MKRQVNIGGFFRRKTARFQKHGLQPKRLTKLTYRPKNQPTVGNSLNFSFRQEQSVKLRRIIRKAYNLWQIGRFIALKWKSARILYSTRMGKREGSKEKFVAKQHCREKVVKKEFGFKKISEKFNKVCDCYH